MALLLSASMRFLSTPEIPEAFAVLGDGASSNIQLLDTNANGKIDRITFEIANPNLETWTLQGASPHGLAVTQTGQPVDINAVSITSLATANPVTIQVALNEAQITQGHIDPTTPEVRANFLALIAKAKGININNLPACQMQTYSDVPTDAWYCPLVEYAAVMGWITEVGGNFRPNDPVTRSTAAGWLQRAFYNSRGGQYEAYSNQ